MTVNELNKKHLMDAIEIIDKIISYIITGKLYIENVNSIERDLILSIPETLIYKLNPNIVEKIDV